jgi:hypothetical protein
VASPQTGAGLVDVEDRFADGATVVWLGLEALHNRSRRQSPLAGRRVFFVETDDQRSLEYGIDIVLVIDMPRIHRGLIESI